MKERDPLKMREFDYSLLEDLQFRASQDTQIELRNFLDDVNDFRKLPGLPYLVSDCGRVIEIFNNGNELNYGDRDGYKIVNMSWFGVPIVTGVHRLVMIAFYGEQKDKSVNHIDGNPSNNNLYNLEWVTPLENTRHAINFGISKTAASLSSKLTRSQVIKIIELSNKGYTGREISKRFGVSGGQVSKIICKKNDENFLLRYNNL